MKSGLAIYSGVSWVNPIELYRIFWGIGMLVFVLVLLFEFEFELEFAFVFELEFWLVLFGWTFYEPFEEFGLIEELFVVDWVSMVTEAIFDGVKLFAGVLLVLVLIFVLLFEFVFGLVLVLILVFDVGIANFLIS